MFSEQYLLVINHVICFSLSWPYGANHGCICQQERNVIWAQHMHKSSAKLKLTICSGYASNYHDATYACIAPYTLPKGTGALKINGTLQRQLACPELYVQQFKNELKFWILIEFFLPQWSIKVEFIVQKLNLNCRSTHHWPFLNWVNPERAELFLVQTTDLLTELVSSISSAFPIKSPEAYYSNRQLFNILLFA